MMSPEFLDFSLFQKTSFPRRREWRSERGV